jgi:hypothetical protein
LTTTGSDPQKFGVDFLQEWDLNVGLEMFRPTDPDYLDFSQFASTLDHNGQVAHPYSQGHPTQMPMPMFMSVQYDSSNANSETGMDDLPDMEEYAGVV